MNDVNINVTTGTVGGDSSAGDSKTKKFRKRHYLPRLPEERLKIGKEMYTKFMNGETILELSEEYGYSSCASTNAAITGIMCEYVSTLSDEEKNLFEERRSHYGRCHREEIAAEFNKSYHHDKCESVSEEKEITSNEDSPAIDGYLFSMNKLISNLGIFYTLDINNHTFIVSDSYDEITRMTKDMIDYSMQNKKPYSASVSKNTIQEDTLYNKIIQKISLEYFE